MISLCTCSGSIIGPCDWCRRNIVFPFLPQMPTVPHTMPSTQDIFNTAKVAQLQQQVETLARELARAQQGNDFMRDWYDRRRDWYDRRRDWYDRRWAELKAFLKGTIYHDEACSIMANRGKGPFEPSMYDQRVIDLEEELARLRIILQTVPDAVGKFNASPEEKPNA